MDLLDLNDGSIKKTYHLSGILENSRISLPQMIVTPRYAGVVVILFTQSSPGDSFPSVCSEKSFRGDLAMRIE